MTKYVGSTPIVDETNEHILAPAADPIIDGVQMSRGRMPRDWQSHPYGSVFSPKTFATKPRSDWKSLLDARTKAGALASGVIKFRGIPPLNQNGTSFCWCNAPTQAVQVTRCLNGQKHVPLSPASVGAPINGFRNQGGWGLDAMKRLVSHGAVPVSLWPANGISRQYDTDAARGEGQRFKAIEWEDLEQGDFDGLATALLLGFVCPIGIDRWSHEVLCVDLVWTGSEWGILIYNSWGESYGDKGFAVLTEKWISSRGTFDAEVLRSVTGSNAA